jgi:hypothetical protein
MLFNKKTDKSESAFVTVEDFTAAVDVAIAQAKASSLNTYALIDVLESRVANIRRQQAMSYAVNPTVFDGQGGYRRP